MYGRSPFTRGVSPSAGANLALSIPPRVAGFRIGAEAAGSTVGRVFAARHEGTGTAALVRLIAPPAGLPSPDWAQTLARLNSLYEAQRVLGTHPGIEAVYAFGEADGLFWAATEYPEAVPLQSLLATVGAMSLLWAVHLFRALAAALDAVATAGCCHGDLLPNDVLVAGLPDGGLQGGGGMGGAMKPARVTLCNLAVAHLRPAYATRYAAPERLDGAPGNSRSDVYAAGALLYEMLSGMPLFLGSGPADLAAKVRSARPAPLLSRPGYVRDVIDALLEKDPARRYATLSQAVADLEARRSPGPDRGTAPATHGRGAGVVPKPAEGSGGEEPLAPRFFVTGGTVPLAATSYVVRQADRDLLTALSSGEYCFVLNSRQMGKSSLCVRAVAQLKASSRPRRVAFLDLTKIGGQNAQPEQWYAGVAAELGREFGLRREVMVHYREQGDVPAPLRLMSVLREVVLEAAPEPTIVFVDEVDSVRSLPFRTDEFFAAIRSCYNGRPHDPALARLTFCLVGSATPTELIGDVHASPFNIGVSVTLRDFTAEEAAPLARGLSGGVPVLARILYWTAGHPYLTQALCAEVARRGASMAVAVDNIVSELYLNPTARTRDPNLADVTNRVLTGSEVERDANLDLYRNALRSRPPIPDNEADATVARLKLSGLVTSVGGVLAVRNPIYARVFDLRWVEENLSGRRQGIPRLGG